VVHNSIATIVPDKEATRMASSFEVNPGTLAWIEHVGDRVVDNILEEIAEDARRYAPVDTGELLASIHVDKSERRVVAEADHAAPVEMGSHYGPAQPYLRPALYKKRVPRAEA